MWHVSFADKVADTDDEARVARPEEGGRKAQSDEQGPGRHRG